MKYLLILLAFLSVLDVDAQTLGDPVIEIPNVKVTGMEYHKAELLSNAHLIVKIKESNKVADIIATGFGTHSIAEINIALGKAIVKNQCITFYYYERRSDKQKFVVHKITIDNQTYEP